jgi:hypothetical protein
MEPPTNTPTTSPRELAQLGKEQTLGDAKYLGCTRFEARKAITETVAIGPTTISGKTASSRESATTTIATAIRKGSATAITDTTQGGYTTI